MKSVSVIIFGLAVCAFMATTSEAGWLIYHKPEFKGKVIDTTTKQPIEGAVVVVIYNKEGMSMGAGKPSSIINVRETTTDKDGDFAIPSYTTIIQPFSWEYIATFIIFKPGYASISGITLEKYLTGKAAKDDEWPWEWNSPLKFITRAEGTVELPNIKTREERLRAMPSPVGENSYYKKQKELIRLINEERKYLGLSGEYTIKGGF